MPQSVANLLRTPPAAPEAAPRTPRREPSAPDTPSFEQTLRASQDEAQQKPANNAQETPPAEADIAPQDEKTTTETSESQVPEESVPGQEAPAESDDAEQAPQQLPLAVNLETVTAASTSVEPNSPASSQASSNEAPQAPAPSLKQQFAEDARTSAPLVAELQTEPTAATASSSQAAPLDDVGEAAPSPKPTSTPKPAVPVPLADDAPKQSATTSAPSSEPANNLTTSTPLVATSDHHEGSGQERNDSQSSAHQQAAPSSIAAKNTESVVHFEVPAAEPRQTLSEVTQQHNTAANDTPTNTKESSTPPVQITQIKAEPAATPARPLTAQPLSPEPPSSLQQATERTMLTSAQRGMSAALAQRGGEMTIRLAPEALGSLRIALSVAQGTVTATLTASNADAASILTKNLDGLRDSIESRGLQVEKLTVATSQTQTSSSDTSDSRSEQHASRRDANQDASNGRSRGRGEDTSPQDQRENKRESRFNQQWKLALDATA